MVSRPGACPIARTPTRINTRLAPDELHHDRWSDPSAVAPARIHHTLAFSSRAAAQRARASEHHPGPTSKRQLLGLSVCDFRYLLLSSQLGRHSGLGWQGSRAHELATTRRAQLVAPSRSGSNEDAIRPQDHLHPTRYACTRLRARHTSCCPPAAAAAARRSRTHTDVMESRAEPTDVLMLAPSVCGVRRAAPAHPRAGLAE